jgi:hypothetical protein
MVVRRILFSLVLIDILIDRRSTPRRLTPRLADR